MYEPGDKVEVTYGSRRNERAVVLGFRYYSPRELGGDGSECFDVQFEDGTDTCSLTPYSSNFLNLIRKGPGATKWENILCSK